MPRSPERDAGLKLRHARKQARLTIPCGYLDRRSVGEGLCTGEAVDPDADVRLCQRHLALVLEPLLPKVYAKMRADILAEVEKTIASV